MKRLFLLFACLFSVQLFAQTIDVLDYEFTIKLSDTTDAIKGNAFIQLKSFNKQGDIALDLTQKKANGKGMTVQSVECDAVKKWEQRNDKLILHFYNDAEYIPDTNQYLIRINYSGIPDDGLIISKNKFGDRTFFADNWPNRAHHWLPCNDRPDDKARVVFTVEAPKKYKIIANGIEVNTDYENSLNANLNSRYSRWSSEDVSLPTKVMVIGAAKFATKQFDNSPNNLPISAWVYPQDSIKGFHDFAVAPEIVQYFSNYIAPFPYKKLANVQSTTIFGGMENASCIFYAEDLVTGDRKHEDVVAHEIAHQWFGDMASEKSFAHLWLSEGFATYFTDLWFEHKYGKEAANKRLEKERKEVIAFANKSSHAVVDSTDNLMSLLNANSYQKGAWVLHMLRNEVGDKIFQQVIQAYYNQYKGGNAETRDFEKITEQITGKDLKWFFDQWLYRPGVPALSIVTKVEGGQFYLYVHQKGQPYRFLLDVDIITKDGEYISRKFAVSEKESAFKVPVKGSAAQFNIDPHTKLLYELQD